MDTGETAGSNSANDRTIASPVIDIDQLVVEVYESAPASEKNHIVAQLVGKIYKDAPLLERSHLLAHLIMPLGVLSLVTVANGIFAKIRFRSGWTHMQVQLEDAKSVQVSDVTALVDYVQQVSIQAIDSLAQLITAEPMMAGSAAATVLVAVLMKRAKTRREGDLSDFDRA